MGAQKWGDTPYILYQTNCLKGFIKKYTTYFKFRINVDTVFRIYFEDEKLTLIS